MLSKQMREALKARAAGDPRAQALLAQMLAGERRYNEAYALAMAAQAAGAGDLEIERLVRDVLSAVTRPWFFPLVRDEVRNAAYDAAIRAAVRPGMRVLDIGTGTGMFAMMAARAGAGHVVSFEQNAATAESARRVVAANGYADRIVIVTADVTHVKSAEEIGGRADLMLSDIMSVNLLDAAASAALAHAAAHLLAPGAKLIPGRAVARVALAEDSQWAAWRMDRHGGFDLSPFNRLAPVRHLTAGEVRLRSTTADILVQDFPPPQAPLAGGAVLTASGGRANGIVQWIALDLQNGHAHENAPGTDAGRGWLAAFFPFESPRDFAEGTKVRVHAEQRGGALHVWTDDAG